MSRDGRLHSLGCLAFQLVSQATPFPRKYAERGVACETTFQWDWQGQLGCLAAQ